MTPETVTSNKSPNDDIVSAFANQVRQNDMAEVLKELFDKEKIFLIGDLTKDECKLATRIYTIAEMKDIDIWKKGLTFYVQLLLSKDRKSRKEVLEAIKGYSQQQSLMQKLNPFNRQ